MCVLATMTIITHQHQQQCAIKDNQQQAVALAIGLQLLEGQLEGGASHRIEHPREVIRFKM